MRSRIQYRSGTTKGNRSTTKCSKSCTCPTTISYSPCGCSATISSSPCGCSTTISNSPWTTSCHVAPLLLLVLFVLVLFLILLPVVLLPLDNRGSTLVFVSHGARAAEKVARGSRNLRASLDMTCTTKSTHAHAFVQVRTTQTH